MTDIREEALSFTSEWYGDLNPPLDITKLLQKAEEVAEFLEGPKTEFIVIRIGPVKKQADDSISPNQKEGIRMQIQDDEKFDVTLAGKDAKGFDVDGEQFSAVSSDESVVTVTQDGDTFTQVAGNPGSAVVTYSEAVSGLSVTEAVDVVPAGIATISVVEGEVTKQ